MLARTTKTDTFNPKTFLGCCAARLRWGSSHSFHNRARSHDQEYAKQLMLMMTRCTQACRAFSQNTPPHTHTNTHSGTEIKWRMWKRFDEDSWPDFSRPLKSFSQTWILGSWILSAFYNLLKVDNVEHCCCFFSFSLFWGLDSTEHLCVIPPPSHYSEKHL